MTVHYKLIYWNCHGRGEITRLIFNYAGEKFEEHTITDADWPGTLKAAMPYGQLPVLEIDGVQLAQGRAIERFLARRFNLVGKTDIEAQKRPYFW
uniref:GST N-terminal domain-containing protein n=1 Tax=Rhabditophanes sp. KR3021 TaxID=114890 RepID=A0AC35TKU3_9BILA